MKHLPEQTNEWSDELALRDKYWSSFTADDVVIDIGGYKGLFTLQALSQGAYCITFEPVSEFYNLIEQSIEMNENYKEQSTVLNAFCGDKEYPKQLMDHMAGFCKANNLQISEYMLSLDYLLPALDEKVSAIKIDVEGGELEVLKGGINLLKKYHPTLIIEDHAAFFPYCVENNTHDKIFDLLTEIGYTVNDEFYLRNFIIAEYK